MGLLSTTTTLYVEARSLHPASSEQVQREEKGRGLCSCLGARAARSGAGAATPLVTPALFLEYEAVLKRPEQRLAHGLGLADIDRFLAAFAAACEAVEVSFQWRPQLGDANDEMVLEAAVNGRAQALVTHNVRDFVKSVEKFGVRVLRPGELLTELRS